MRQSIYQRRKGQTKKDLYKRLAKIRKAQCVNGRYIPKQDYLKSHSCPTEDDTSSNDCHNKNSNTKIEQKAVQKVRNRIAAQQSREKHKNYVQELELKAKNYDQIINRMNKFCTNCQQHLAFDGHVVSSEERQNTDLWAKQQIPFDSYLDEQMIRIDNEGTTSPFGIFFIICIVAVIAVFSFRGNNEPMTHQLLVNFHSDSLQYGHEEGTENHQNYTPISDLLESNHLKINSSLNSSLSQEMDLPGFQKLLETQKAHLPIPRGKHWKKIGNYVCSQPKITLNKTENNSNRSQFFVFRAKGHPTSSIFPNATFDFQIQQSNQQQFKMFPKEWQSIQISECTMSSASE